jgi:hypothetical protein
MFREAVLLHARTLEPMQAMPWEYNLVSGTPRKSQGMTIRLLSDMKRKRVVLGLLVEGEGSKKKDSI